MDSLKKVVQLTQQQYDSMMDDADHKLKDTSGTVLHEFDENIFYCIPEDLDSEITTSIKPITDATIDTMIPSP